MWHGSLSFDLVNNGPIKRSWLDCSRVEVEVSLVNEWKKWVRSCWSGEIE